jgi:hypothetical protein
MKGLLTAVIDYINSVIEKLPTTGHNVSETGHSDRATAALIQPDLEADCMEVHDLENITPR